MIAGKIKEIRLATDVNQEDFAVSLGITQSAVSLYESGARIPTVRICYRILNYCDHNDLHHLAKTLEDLLPREAIFLSEREVLVA